MGLWALFPIVAMTFWMALQGYASFQAQNNPIDNGTASEQSAAQQFIVLTNACQAYGEGTKGSITSTASTVSTNNLQLQSVAASNVSAMSKNINFTCYLQQSGGTNYAISVAQITNFAANLALQFNGNSNQSLGYATNTQMNNNQYVQLSAGGPAQTSPVPIAAFNLPTMTAYDPATSSYTPGFALSINEL